MINVSKSIWISAPREKVFSIASDYRKWEDWYVGLSGVKPTTASITGTGCRYAYSIKFMGIRMPVETEIKDYTKNRGWKGVSTRGMKHITSWNFEIIGNGTILTMGITSGIPVPVVGILLDHGIMKSYFENNILASLTRLKRKIEACDLVENIQPLQ